MRDPPKQQVREEETQGQAEREREGNGLEDVRQSRQHDQGSHQDLRDAYAIVGFGLEAPIEAKAEGSASKGEEGKGREHLYNLHEVFI
ncbi:hypothetical protein RC74_18700 [Falsihalocynthiibacter arcticus]|uniref:Uncharacterized protein n=1 Tax=Falsihalocynthiibacter arcticus TaxID=1579316 RepID=A0A126V559_9RHOB|nr:hypothetical protein RC74_18700 [Falsihalocynthiibacter arcticus]